MIQRLLQKTFYTYFMFSLDLNSHSLKQGRPTKILISYVSPLEHNSLLKVKLETSVILNLY